MRVFWIQKILALLFNLFILGLGLLLPNNDSLAELPKPYFDSLPVPNISGKVIGEVFADRDQVLWFNIEDYLQRFELTESTLFNSAMDAFYHQSNQLDFWNRYFPGVVKGKKNQLKYYLLSTGEEKILNLVDAAGTPIGFNAERVPMTFSQQAIWFLTENGQFYRGRLNADIDQQLRLDPILVPVNLDTGGGSIWLRHAHDHLWLANKNHLLAYDSNSGVWRDFSAQLPSPLAVYGTFFMAESEDGTAWFALYNEKKNLFKIKGQNLSAKTLTDSTLYDILYDKQRQWLWITSSNGLYTIDAKTDAIRHFPAEIWQDVGLSTPLFRKLHQDQQGNLWISSNKGVVVLWALHRNVSRIVPTSSPHLQVGTTIKPSQSLQPDAKKASIVGLTVDSLNHLWWFNLNNELIRYDTLSGKETIIPIPFALPRDKPFSIAFKYPFVLLTTYRGELLKYDIQNRRFIKSEFLFGADKWINNFFLIHPSAQNARIWFSRFDFSPDPNQNKNDFLARFAYYDTVIHQIKEFTCLLDQQDIIHEITDEFTFKQFSWMSSWHDDVVLQLDRTNRRCRSLQLPQKDVTVNAVSQLDDDHIWVVQGNALYQIELPTLKIVERIQLPITSTDVALVDENSDFLIAGDSSLWRYKIRERRFELVFVSQTTILFKAHKPFYNAASGQFYALTGQGIVVIDTRKPPIIPDPTVLLSSYQIDNVKTTVFDQRLTSVSLDYQQALRLNFFAVPVVPDKMQQFRYRTDSNQDWKILPGHQNQLMLTNLPLNKSKLEVQVAYGQAKFSPIKIIQLNVRPPWWRTELAYSLYLLSLLLLIYLVIYWQRSRERLRSARLMVSIFENTSEGLCVLDSQGRIVRINQSLQAMLGWRLHENLPTLLQQIEPFESDMSHLLTFNTDTAEKQQPWKGEATLLRPDSTPILVELTLDKLSNATTEKHGHYVMVVEDVTERKRHEQNLLHQSEHDYLTGLPNRLYFDKFTRQILVDNDPDFNYRFAFVMLDLDDFKRINDRLGHKIGDLLLIELANILKKLLAFAPCPLESLVARHSGDEFLLLLKIPDQGDDRIHEWLTKLIDMLSHKRMIQKNEIEVSASAGVSILPDFASDPELLLQQADMAMYVAKKQGKSCFAYFDTQLEIALKHQLEIEDSLTEKIAHHGLLVYYQPKVAVNSGKIIGFEALVRWRLLSGELLQPGQFLPLIRSGKIDRLLNQGVLRQAVQDMTLLTQIKPTVKVSVNLSPKYLDDVDYLNELCGLITHQSVSAHCFVFEILEDAGIDNPAVLANLDIIRNFGIGISIDDFGTGYSSLSHLNQIRASELKIDRSFITPIPGDKQAEDLFRNIMALAKQFDMHVVCEGVETQAQLDFIKACGCSCYQGYFFSKPVPLANAQELLSLYKCDEP